MRWLVAFCGTLIVVLLATPGPQAAPTLRPPLSGGFPGGPYFVVGCGFSHRNNDDPIVFPGAPGSSHNHTYIGNRSVDAASTPASLRGGSSTCGDDGDSSAYWVPTLFVRGLPVRPLAGVIYYVRRTWESVRPFPAGLKMIAGDAHAHNAQPLAVASWSCGTKRASTVPACSPNQVLQLRVDFPNCWNGRSVDSPDHKGHMAYASAGRCPQAHPVAVPSLTLILFYEPVERAAQLASGRFGSHADFINGWDQEILARLVSALN